MSELMADCLLDALLLNLTINLRDEVFILK